MLFDIMEQHFKRTIGPGRGVRQEVAAVLIPELTSTPWLARSSRTNAAAAASNVKAIGNSIGGGRGERDAAAANHDRRAADPGDRRPRPGPQFRPDHHPLTAWVNPPVAASTSRIAARAQRAVQLGSTTIQRATCATSRTAPLTASRRDHHRVITARCAGTAYLAAGDLICPQVLASPLVEQPGTVLGPRGVSEGSRSRRYWYHSPGAQPDQVQANPAFLGRRHCSVGCDHLAARRECADSAEPGRQPPGGTGGGGERGEPARPHVKYSQHRAGHETVVTCVWLRCIRAAAGAVRDHPGGRVEAVTDAISARRHERQVLRRPASPRPRR
jgi:hypothetical protein